MSPSDFHTDLVRAMDALLGEQDAPVTSYYAQGDLSWDAISVWPLGMECLSGPVSDSQIAQLKTRARQAAYGLKDKTLVDQGVRDTSEITGEQIELRWQDKVLEQLQTQLRAGLGLPIDAPLSLQLHNLLIYEEGQFFKPHQDTEKVEGMVATLVLVLPSGHLGGDLVLTHQKKTHRFKSEHLSTKRLKWLAFYADCQHEVKPVTQGHRLVLTFNVALQAVQDVSEVSGSAQPNAELLRALKAHLIETSTTHDASKRQLKRLVYYLDHQYTEHGLRWARLKGTDRTAALALKQAAQVLGLKVHLALAKIHQMWTAQEDDFDSRYGRHSRQVSEPEPGELIDWDASLDFWVNAQDVVQPFGRLGIKGEDICWRRETDDADLADTEYEGYMGNYGNTIVYWYRRAAVVLWSEDAQIGMDFELGFDAALRELSKKTEPHQVKRMTRIAMPWLVPQKEIQYFHAYNSIAVQAQDAAMATLLMEGFLLRDFRPEWAVDMALLGRAYGQEWLDQMLAKWCAHMKHQANGTHRYVDDFYAGDKSSPVFPIHLTKVFQALQGQAIASTWIETLLQGCSESYQSETLRYANSSERALNAVRPQFLKQLLDLWQVCMAHRYEQVLNLLVQHVLAQGRIYPLVELAPLLIDLGSALPSGQRMGLEPLYDRVAWALDQTLAEGLRASSDQSIAVSRPHCHCGLCAPVFVFLQSTQQTELILPMAEAKREHVQSQFTQLDLPLTFDTLRTGSPHKLQICKSSTLYQQAKKRYEWLLAQRSALPIVKK